jgi:CDP-diacylglycerol--inositol 3-phosphatidyltransferase
MVSIYFYIPNIIDYFRFVSLFFALYYFDKDPITFTIVYFISFGLDLFDGMAARHFKQFSRIGAALDMIADRLTTASLLMILGRLYPNYFVTFLLLVLLDVGSHWLQVYSSLLEIAENKSIKNHKEVKEKFIILDIYYHNRFVLFNTCLFAEIFLLLSYLNYFYFDWMKNDIYKGFYYFSLSIYVFKQICSIFQIFGASERVVDIDVKEKKQLKGN